MADDNISQQKDEIEALSSIYDSDWKSESDSGNYYSMQFDSEVKLYITLNSDYPSKAPPTYQLTAPSFSRSAKQRIRTAFEEIYLENVGHPVIFQWIEALRGMVYDNKKHEKRSTEDNSDSSDESESEESPNLSSFSIVHGPAITDRKSTFQGHYCEIKSQADVKSVINLLLQNKKIHQATHNISAYRIKSESGSILQDCNDDGEHHAGGRLMHLLQILDVENVLVVVSRWYGGIQLGPDRFRHINNAARQALLEAGAIKSNN